MELHADFSGFLNILVCINSRGCFRQVGPDNCLWQEQLKIIDPKILAFKNAGFTPRGNIKSISGR